MHNKPHDFMHLIQGIWSAVFVSLLLIGCGGDSDGPAIQAQSQSIHFDDVATMTLVTSDGMAVGETMVSASASSGLALTFTSMTPDVCSVDRQSGAVTVHGPITVNTPDGCRIAADQYGNNVFAPARQEQLINIYIDPHQTVRFSAAPALSLFSTATVSATASSGLSVTYSSLTPAVCSVDATTGLVRSLSTGECQIAAHQAGSALFNAAADETQTIPISVPPGLSVPGAPTGVTATLGTTPNTVTVSIGATDSGGSPITGYVVNSLPAGLRSVGTTSPITIACGTSCSGYAFTVTAHNAIGASQPSASTDVITAYNIVETFYEPATQPNNSIFTGTFNFNSTLGTVTDLTGTLTQSMTGGSTSLTGGASSNGSHYGDIPMTLVSLSHQLSAQPVTLGGVQGLLVTTFALPTTDTFFKGGMGDLPVSDGWSPDTGVDVGGIYYGFPTAPNPAAGGTGNAYAMIFVNISDPAVAPTPAQISRLAYADCTAGGMMGAVCMTGTAVAGYRGAGEGSVGTMGGYPLSQTITRRP